MQQVLGMGKVQCLSQLLRLYWIESRYLICPCTRLARALRAQGKCSLGLLGWGWGE